MHFNKYKSASGGKTTILEELFIRLKHDRLNPIYISFNGNWDLDQEGSLTERLCRRIGFAMMKDDCVLKSKPLEALRCPPDLITQHLGDQSAILLIDELNMWLPNPALMPSLQDDETQKMEEQGKSAAKFLKANFLGKVRTA